MKFRHLFFALFAILIATCAFPQLSHAAISVTGSRYVVVDVAKSTGLESVIVIEDASQATLSYTTTSASSAGSAVWMRFGTSGGGYAQSVEGATASGSVTSFRPGAGDSGYIVEVAGRQTAWWIIDYAGHQPSLTDFSISQQSECDRVFFDPTGVVDRINYYSVTGVPTELDREMKLTYDDLELYTPSGSNGSEGDEMPDGSGNADLDAYWRLYSKTVNFADISGTFSTAAPLCNTQFHLSGDRFLSAWGDPISLSTPTYNTRRVEAKTWAIQDVRDNNNESNSSTSGLGGSAPCDITFRAAVTDAAVFTEWQFSSSEDFEDIVYRFNETEFTYTFTEYGTTYVRFVCADASGDCTYESDVYTVMIGESRLQCPNAFSPHNQDGVNDEWKVSYSSLISYECHIFNRWGKQLFSSTNPAEGWDGKVGGKFVPSGVYFYVIRAEGSDGVKYKLDGDINIIGSKLRPSTGDGGSEGVVEP